MDHFLSDSEDSENENDGPPRKRPTYRPRINFEDLNEFQFKEKFQLSAVNVESLLRVIGPQLDHGTLRNRALSPKEQLLCALHFFATGTFYHVVADGHGPSKATMCQVVHNVATSARAVCLLTKCRVLQPVC